MSEFKEQYLKPIRLLEKLCKYEEIPAFDMYFLGGSGCILGNYIERHTADYDFVDIGYTPRHGSVLKVLGDCDILVYEFCSLSPKFKERSIKIEEFKYLNVYVLSREDIIISKLARYIQKDKEDISKLIVDCDTILLEKIANEVLNRSNLIEKARDNFIKNYKKFKEDFNV